MINIQIESGFKDELMIFIEPTLIDHDQDLFITELGYFPNAQFHYRKRQGGCQQYILIKCLKGIGYIRIRKHVHKIEANRVAIIPKGVPHSYWADDDNPWSIHWIHFDGPSVLEKYPILKEFQLQKLYRNQSTTITSSFVTMLDNLNFFMIESTVEHAVLTLRYILNTIFIGIVFTKPEKEDHVKNAISFMKSNVFSSLTLSEIAEECNISKSQLSLLFSKEMNTSPINFFLTLKIELAVKYLLLTDMNIKEIGYRLGFKDQYYFSRLFKNIMGVSPLQYKKENRTS
jgi:AraC-like DNA-binding protein